MATFVNDKENCAEGDIVFIGAKSIALQQPAEIPILQDALAEIIGSEGKESLFKSFEGVKESFLQKKQQALRLPTGLYPRENVDLSFDQLDDALPLVILSVLHRIWLNQLDRDSFFLAVSFSTSSADSFDRTITTEGAASGILFFEGSLEG